MFWAISTLWLLVAGKASRVLVDRWITSKTFHDVQNANRRCTCTGHATTSTERGNYRLITVHAPFLAIWPNKKSLSNCCMEALSHWPEYEKFRKMCSMEFYQNILYLRVTHCAFRALQKFYSDHCLKHFCEFPNNISFSFLLKKTNPHSLQQSSKHCGSIVQRTNCKVAFWFSAIARKGACTVISRSFARSVDIVAWPV